MDLCPMNLEEILHKFIKRGMRHFLKRNEKSRRIMVGHSNVRLS